MDKFKAWLDDFMRGRYGQDDLNRSILVAAIVVIIASLVCQLLAAFLGTAFRVLASFLNAVALILLFITFFRSFSRKFEVRKAENDRFLKWKRKNDNKKEYKYLKCPHCAQEMRVPRGKGKIAVKCPKCGESTITKS